MMQWLENPDWIAIGLGALGIVTLSVAALHPDTDGFDWWLRLFGRKKK